MIRVIMHGCNGKMGQVITDIRYLQISMHVMLRQM